eukprot:Rhum_TRINITY_DN14673_c12_g2::Rhum_TRINITY_DN14673_c12_g2_i1::g.108170::m.108170
MASVVNGAIAQLAIQFGAPQFLRGIHQAVAAQRVERHARNLQAVKQNKVDLRSLLALPVYDPAHPYYLEKPWEVYFKAEQPAEAATTQGKLHRWEALTQRENRQHDIKGCLHDDLESEWHWSVRVAVKRLPKEQKIWRQRRIGTANRLCGPGGYQELPSQYWIHPSDDVAYLSQYINMASDEAEEKWGFMAGEEAPL